MGFTILKIGKEAKVMVGIKKLFKQMDLTEGRPWKVMLLFSLPILLTLILNNAFSLINALVLKTTVGGDSVSAINSTTSISNILLQFAYGVGSGFTILMSEQIGKKDYTNLKKIFYNAIYLSIGIGALISIVGLVFYKDLLFLLNINERYFDKASAYYRIILIAFIFMMLNNFFSNALRAIGDSMAPLIISLISTCVNVILAILFTGVIHLDTRGVAIATLIANLINALISYIYLIKKYEYLHHDGRFEEINRALCKKMIGLGLPLGLQWSVLFIGSFIQDSSINKFGNGLATKAVSCYSPFTGYLGLLFSSFASSALNFMGQNYGKEDFKRIKQGFTQGIVVIFCMWIFMMLIGFLMLDYVPYIFLPKEEVNDLVEGPVIKYYCSTYLKIIFPCYILQGILVLSRQTLQGIQKTIIPFISGIGELLARSFICLVIPSLINPHNPLSDESFVGICFSTPAAWIMSVLIMGGSVIYILFIKYKEN